jgi:pimeloyl-ACP methyl ester carboxylesterase
MARRTAPGARRAKRRRNPNRRRGTSAGRGVALAPVQVAPVDGGHGRAVGALAIGASAVLGALVGWALDRRWLGAPAGDALDPEDPGGSGDRGLELPEGEEHVVVTDDGAELAVTLLRPEGARKGRFLRRRAPATVVLAHGWTNTRAVWAPVARRLLEAGHPVVAYDQRGHGASTFGPEAPTVQRLGEDLAAVLAQLDVRDAVLAGHSMGGFSVLAYAVDHHDELPHRARGLALVGTAAHGVGLGSLDQLASRVVGGQALNWLLARPRLGLLLLRGAVGRHPRRTDIAVTRDLFLATKPEVRAACYLLCTQMDLRAGLPTIDVPTVVLAGARDSVTPAHLGRTIADMVPGARFELLPDAGHMLLLEETDRVVAAILRLAGDGGDDAADEESDDADVPAEAGEVPAPTRAD